MIDMKMGGGDKTDCPEGSLQGVDAEILNGHGGADAAHIDNHQAIFLIRDEVRLSKPTPRYDMHHLLLPFFPRFLL